MDRQWQQRQEERERPEITVVEGEFGVTAVVETKELTVVVEAGGVSHLRGGVAGN